MTLNLRCSLVFLIVLWANAGTLCSAQAEHKPNIIIFFTDDQGYADVGAYGAKGFKTPHIDKLATQGIQFTNFYVPATVCTPSRAALLTGRYPVRSGLHEAVLFPFSEHGLNPNEFTLAELLKANNYTTSCIGKWHLGHLEKYMPNNQGFDEFYGVPYSNDMGNYYYKSVDFKAPPLPFYRNTKLIESGPNQQFLTKRYTEETIRQIKNRGKNPFFIYLAHNMPHRPLYASPAFKGKSKKGLYGDVIEELDWSVGEIVKTLKEEGVYENTLFIFTSDNGPDLGSAHPLRGKKGQTWEGGQRVPGIISWPEKIRGNQINKTMVSTLDLFPTILEIVGGKKNQDLKLDGIDISQLLFSNKNYTIKERPFFYFAKNGNIEAVRYGKWKLHIDKSSGWNKITMGTFKEALYNLELDKAESKNVANQNPEVVKQLRMMINHFK